ncbi:unnamed protein product [Prorocentrum cordatum]|uniref:Uncharacterized protein n=1 Tax=Prorocentrum cordatum TaxID=2364126 RepID=A0ABN9YEE8_9DINO|nr:unnamed protein product [Polarella glacialis]
MAPAPAGAAGRRRALRGRRLGAGAALLVAGCLAPAFVPGGAPVGAGRRAALAQQGILAAVLAGSLAEPARADEEEKKPSKWSGNWEDPDAPGCRRQVIVNFDGTKAAIRGTASLGNPNVGLVDSKPGVDRSACNPGDKTVKWCSPRKRTQTFPDNLPCPKI